MVRILAEDLKKLPKVNLWITGVNAGNFSNNKPRMSITIVGSKGIDIEEKIKALIRETTD